MNYVKVSIKDTSIPGVYVVFNADGFAVEMTALGLLELSTWIEENEKQLDKEAGRELEVIEKELDK